MFRSSSLWLLHILNLGSPDSCGTFINDMTSIFVKNINNQSEENRYS